MTHSLFSRAADLFRSMSTARKAVRHYDEMLSQGDEPSHAVSAVFEAYYCDETETEPKTVAPNRVDVKAWDRLVRASPRYAE